MDELDPNLSLDWSGQSFRGLPALREKVVERLGLCTAMLLGSTDFIDEARRIQCMLGGVMRQVGFMAAAALYGFRHNLTTLAKDHANCSFMASRLVGNSALDIDLQGVQTNILYFKVKAGTQRAAGLVDELAEEGIGALNVGSLVRLVTSINVARKDCELAVETIIRLLK